MASFMNDLAKPYVEKLINGAIAESSYICCFTCIAKDFEEEKSRLEKERSTVKQRVDVATSRGEVVQANALCWEEEADNLIQEDTETKQRCLFGFCPHIIWRYKRGKELTNKKEQMKRLIETGKQLSIGLPARLPDVERYSSQNYIPFKSRESKYKELLDALKDDNNYVIGLKGMGGTGKTTLAKEVGKELKQSNQFTQIIDTTVSFSPDIKKIQDDIAGPLGLKFDDCSESDRPKKLWSRLTNGEKILLILDDVWGDIDFNEIGIPYCDNHKGCRILVTTRNLWVCKRLGCNKIVQLNLLSKEDAWIMFQMHAGLSKTSAKNLLEKGRKIANECKELPVAIAAIASSLKGEQRREEWDLVLNSLQKHMSLHGVDTELLTIYKCFQVSYNNLKNENAKRLFLMCSVFREDEKVYTEMLTRICIGAGILGEDCGNYGNARHQFVRSRNKLIDSCLLLEVDQSMVKMHDLVRDAAQWIANKEIQTVKLYDKNQKAMVEREENIKYLLCESKLKDVFSFKLDGSKLEILIVIVHKDEDCQNVKIEVPNSFFENIMGLRVFHLIHHDYSKLDLSLPHSIQSLKNIRSLLFTRVNLGDISILGNLQSLETLDLDDCEIDELPHGITKLKKLKLLNLEECEIARNDPFEVIKGCLSLEELYFTGSFNDFCKEITFPKLRRFNIDEDWSSVDESSSKRVSVVFKDKFFLSETTLKYCMQEAEVLELGRIEGGWRNIIPEIVPLDQGMNHIVELRLRSISQLQCLIDTKHIESQVSKVFSKLVVLKLDGMDNLEELFNGPLSFDSLNNLEKLSIEDCKHLKSLFKCNLNLFNLKSVLFEGCPMLISLFQMSTARSLVLLERLEIYDCGCLEYIIDERKGQESRGEIVDDNNSTIQGSMFQKLKVLSIKKCPELEIILPFQSSHDLPALESITVESCDKLKYIFGQDVQLGSLKKMKLGGIPNFIDIFPECNRTMCLSIKKPSSISGDASEPQEQSEPIKCNIYCCGKKYGHRLRRNTRTKTPLVSKDQPQDNLMKSTSYSLNIWESAQCLSIPSYILCNIKEITLSNISKMKSVFILSIAPIMLLETLWIRNCDELKHIIIDTGDHDNTGGNNLLNVFPNLRNVRVVDCEKLEYIIGHFTDDHQNHTEIHLHLPVLETFILRNLPSLVSMCPKQYHTTFPPLKHLQLNNCGDGKIIKELSGNVDHFLALERLVVKNNSKVESIICLNEINEQQMNLALKDIDLDVLPMMTCLFVGPKNSFSLQNLAWLKIKRCEKLKIVFSTSIIRCLPQLYYMGIEECNELKHIIEDDLENKKSSNVMSTTKTCFPKLDTLVVKKCNKLKYVFPISICKDLPELYDLRIEECNKLRHIIEDDFENKNSSNFMSTKTCFPKLKILVVVKCNKLKYVFPISICKELPVLKILTVREADELEEIFGSEGDDHKVEIPNLKFVEFVNLPSLYHDQGIQFQAVKYRFIQNCPKLSLASASTPDFENDISASDFGYDIELFIYWKTLFQQLQRETKSHDSGNENPSPQTTKDFAVGIEVQTALEHKLTSPQIKMKETPETENELIENVPDLEIPTSLKELMNEQSMDQQRSLGETDTAVKPSQCLKETEDQSIQGGPTSKTRNEPSIQLVSDLDVSQETTQTNDNQVFLNDDAVMKVRSHREEQFPKDDDVTVLKSKLSPSIESPIASQFPSIPSKDFDLYLHTESVYQQFQAKSKGHDNGNENPTAQTTKEFAAWVVAEAASRNALTSLKLEGSTSENTAAATLSTISGTKNELPIQLDVAPKQKGMKISFEEGTRSTYDKTITSSTHSGDGDGKICKPTVSIVNINPPAIKYVDIGDSSEIIAMEDINKLIEEDPVLAFEKLLTGGQSFSIRTLLQELKTLMDSSSDVDHLVSNQESKLKFISLLRVLNHHQGLLPSNVKEFVENVQNFFNDYIVKHAASQHVLKKHSQLLDLKTNLMQKLWSAKSTQAHIDGESSTANAQIHELSLQMDNLEKQQDDLKSVVNKCDVQKEKLKDECTEWARESKELLSALVSTEVDVVEVELARKLATEGFATFKSSFPAF